MQGGLFSTVEHPQSQFASLEYITNHRYAWFFKQHVVQMMCVILLDYLDNHESIASSMHLTAKLYMIRNFLLFCLLIMFSLTFDPLKDSHSGP